MMPAPFVHIRIGTSLDQAEQIIIGKTLEYTRNDKPAAAAMLGISLKTLYNKLKKPIRDLGRE